MWTDALVILVHSDAFCLILVHWGLDKPLLKIQGGHKMKKCSPEKVSLIKCLRIDTLYTQNLDFITHELTCSRYDLAKVDFWQIQKLKISLLRKKKSHADKIYSFQLFAHFSTDSNSPEIKFFKSGFKYSCMFV